MTASLVLSLTLAMKALAEKTAPGAYYQGPSLDGKVSFDVDTDHLDEAIGYARRIPESPGLAVEVLPIER